VACESDQAAIQSCEAGVGVCCLSRPSSVVIRMSEAPKVGILYRDERPRFLVEDISPEAPLQLEFISDPPVDSGPVSPRPDFAAVFFPVDGASDDVASRLKLLFPGAELVGYRLEGPGETAVLQRGPDGLPVVQFPINVAAIGLLLESLAAGRAIENELLRVRHRADELQELLETFMAAVESAWTAADRKLAISLMLNKLLSRIGAEDCLVYMFAENRRTLQRTYGTGNIKDIDLFDYHVNGAILEGVVQSGVPFLNNGYSFELKVPFSKESVFVRSVLCYPLERRGEKIGVLEILNKLDGGFTQTDRRLVEGIVGPLAIALRTVAMFEYSERLTITDDLTKLYNYRYLMQYLEAEVKRCLRYKKKVSLLFVDIDGFKRINDTFGHLVGSQALAEMGQVFRKILRETDVVGRYGGDEFVIVLPETPLNGAMVIAERIRKKVEDYEFASQDLRIRLTVSLGVANCPKHTLTAEGLIKKADAAMYRAKEISKNSIKVAV